MLYLEYHVICKTIGQCFVFLVSSLIDKLSSLCVKIALPDVQVVQEAVLLFSWTGTSGCVISTLHGKDPPETGLLLPAVHTPQHTHTHTHTLTLY